MLSFFGQSASVIVGACVRTLTDDDEAWRYVFMVFLLIVNFAQTIFVLLRQPCNFERVNLVIFAAKTLDCWSCIVGLFAIANKDSIAVALAWFAGTIAWGVFTYFYVTSSAVHRYNQDNEHDNENQLSALRMFCCCQMEELDQKEDSKVTVPRVQLQTIKNMDKKVFGCSEEEVNALSRQIAQSQDQLVAHSPYDGTADSDEDNDADLMQVAEQAGHLIPDNLVSCLPNLHQDASTPARLCAECGPFTQSVTPEAPDCIIWMTDKNGDHTANRECGPESQVMATRECC